MQLFISRGYFTSSMRYLGESKHARWIWIKKSYLPVMNKNVEQRHQWVDFGTYIGELIFVGARITYTPPTKVSSQMAFSYISYLLLTAGFADLDSMGRLFSQQYFSPMKGNNLEIIWYGCLPIARIIVNVLQIHGLIFIQLSILLLLEFVALNPTCPQ